MAMGEAYMLRRDAEESERLDQQHAFMRELAHGHLVQPSISTENLQAIADVGTGTGIWLRQAARELNLPNVSVTNGAAVGDTKPEFVGFDISAQQFSGDEIPGVQYAVHDIVHPFPTRYHGKFGLVHVRLLSYALKARDLHTAVENVIQIIRPGGYLQWQECDPSDSWSLPESYNARSTIGYLIGERVARGLTPAIVSPLTKAIMLPTMSIPKGMVSTLNCTGEIMRVMHLETFSTQDHPSQLVGALKREVVKAAAVQLLQASVLRKEGLLKQGTLSADHSREVEMETSELRKLIDAWIHGHDPACNQWEFAMTSIVAQKTSIVKEHYVSDK